MDITDYIGQFPDTEYPIFFKINLACSQYIILVIHCKTSLAKCCLVFITIL